MPTIGFAQRRFRPVWAGLGVLLAVGFSAAVSHGAEVRLVMPKDRSVVSDGKLLVFGSSGPSEKLPIHIENKAGSQIGTVRSDARGWLKFSVGLEAGRNRIRVGATQQEIFLAAPGVEPPAEFLPLFVHTGQAQPCETCHQADGTFAGGGYPDVCLQCHVIEAANPEYRGPLTKERHFQVSGSQCGKCHDPHGERDMSLLRASPAVLCALCHGERDTSGNVHGAFAKGSCMACHDAHVSGFPRLVMRALPGLCLDCHATITRGPGDHPDALRDCVACHDPHGKAKSGLLRKDIDARCVACHDGVRQGKTVHAALDEGCVACHRPHREDDLARAAVTCDGCHTLAGADGVWARHGGLEVGGLPMCSLSPAPRRCRCSPGAARPSRPGGLAGV